MAISLESVRRVRAEKPARMVIYGPPGIGKTTLASEFPNPIFLQVEEGTPGDVELSSFGELKSFGEVMDALAALYEGEHDYKTIVVDSITALERLVFAETCIRGDDKGNAKKNVEDFGYGKGYVYAQKVWQDFIEGVNALRLHRNMTIILIAHSTVERFDDPETVSYDRYEIELHAKSVGAIEREMDAILLLKQAITIKAEDQGFNKQRARADGGNLTLIHTQPRPAYTAKNRYGMPPTLRYDRGQGFAVLAPYLPGVAPVAAAETETAAEAERA